MGGYWEKRDIIFSPKQERTEQMVDRPFNNLHRIGLTEEDFRDMREVQPFLLTKDQTFLYETHFRGEESMDGVDCYVDPHPASPDLAGPAAVRGHVVGG